MFRKIHNADQNAGNTVKLYESESGCCTDGNIAQCQYDITIPTANAVNSITYKDENGDNKTTVFSPAVTGATDVKAAINAAIVAEGFDDDNDVVVGVSSTVSGSNTIYHVTGEIVIVSMLHNTVTSVNATAKCIRIANCTYTLADSAGGATNSLEINGVAEALGAITPGTTSAATVKTAVETALSNQSVTGTVAVTISGTGVAELYTITITDVISTTTLVLNDEQFVRSSCVATYTA